LLLLLLLLLRRMLAQSVVYSAQRMDGTVAGGSAATIAQRPEQQR
jgi:hypothetical protein